MRQAGEVNYTNTHQVQPQHELLSGAIITINVLLRVGVERELLSLGRAATWSKFYLSAKSNLINLKLLLAQQILGMLLTSWMVRSLEAEG